jgi:DNA-directed RNA polymerase subunit RPC12/RpoP
MTHVAAFRISAICERCNARTGVVRLDDERRCARCDHTSHGTLALIDEALGQEADEARAHLQTFARSGSFDDHQRMMVDATLSVDLFDGPAETLADDDGLRVTRTGCDVRCAQCAKAVHVSDELLVGSHLDCACGTRLPIRPLPAELSKLGWEVTHVIDEAPSGVPVRPAETRVFACGHCGAALRAVAGGAPVECSYCHTTTVPPQQPTPVADERTLFLATTQARRASTRGALVNARASVHQGQAAATVRRDRTFFKVKIVYFALSALGLLALLYVLYLKNKG